MKKVLTFLVVIGLILAFTACDGPGNTPPSTEDPGTEDPGTEDPTVTETVFYLWDFENPVTENPDILGDGRKGIQTTYTVDGSDRTVQWIEGNAAYDDATFTIVTQDGSNALQIDNQAGIIHSNWDAFWVDVSRIELTITNPGVTDLVAQIQFINDGWSTSRNYFVGVNAGETVTPSITDFLGDSVLETDGVTCDGTAWDPQNIASINIQVANADWSGVGTGVLIVDDISFINIED